MSHRIVLAVSGSIAAFKGVQLASDLVKAGYQVRPILTSGGARFVTPLSLSAIAGYAATTEVWDEQANRSSMGHLELARWADLLVVAPASAHTIARLALGLADDMLGSTFLATRAPLVIAPAMESAMWGHPTTQDHVRTLVRRGALVVGPESGRLASGASGEGRMAEPADILAVVDRTLRSSPNLEGRRVLVTAGPTYEPIDPVRFIGNRSSGKMGYAIAEEAAARGADVVLVSGPSSVEAPPGVELIPVESQQEMRRAVLERAANQDVLVMAAAVSDFRPERPATEKLERRGTVNLHLVPTEDIAAEAARAAPNAIHVGFALETGDLANRAAVKLRRKGQQLVVANELSDENSPFDSDTNRVVFITADETEELPELPKREVARRMWDKVSELLARR